MLGGGTLRDRRLVGLLALTCLGLSIAPVAAGADSMTIVVVPPSMSSLFRDATLVYLEGPIDPDAPDRLARALDGVEGKIVAWLNSAGGNLFAGMQLGRILRRHGAWTQIVNSRTLLPGECYSACGLAFLGGVRRSNDSGARYGVHRASLQAAQASGDRDLAQYLSAAIRGYMREMGVDTRLLDLWGKAGPDGMYLLSRREAEDLRVVNDGGARPE
jgi:hypothetical protein